MASENILTEIFVGKYLQSTLLNELNSQRNASKYCDVILKVFDAQIPAHSNVLAAGSPYICAFLAQTMPRQYSQASPQIIELQIDDNESKDLYQNAVKKIIEFIYTTTIEINETEVPKILLIAKILQMGQIVCFCEQFSQRLKDGDSIKCITVVDKNIPASDSESDERSDLARDETEEVKVATEIEGHDVDFCNETGSRGGPSTGSSDSRGRGRSRGMKRSHDHHYTHSETLLGRKNLTKPIQDSKMIYIKSTKPRFRKKKRRPSDVDKHVDNDSKTKENVSGIRRSTRSVKPNPRHVEDKFDDKRDVMSFLLSKDVESDSMESDGQEDDSTGVDINDPLAVAKQLMCSKCDYKTTNSYRFKRHLSVHAGGKYSCDICNFSTAKLKDLSLHRREHQHEKNQCSYCSYTAESREELKEHLAKHEGPLRYFCQFCDKRFKTQTQLKSHIPIHSDEKPFVCNLCSMGFKWKHALKNHMVVHSEEKNHLCDVCGYATAHKSQLKAHHLLHTGETFKCNYPDCNFQAIKKQNLKYHQLTHTREKPHQCEICGQSFSLVKNLRRHMMLHSSSKPHQCELCSFSTTRYDKLKEHVRRQHQMGKASKPTRPGQLQMLSSIIESSPHACTITSAASSVSPNIQPDSLHHSIRGQQPVISASASPLTSAQHLILNSQQGDDAQKLAFDLSKADAVPSPTTVPNTSLEQLGTASQGDNTSVIQTVELGTGSDGQTQILPSQNIVLRPVQYFEIQFPAIQTCQNVEVVDLKQDLS